MRGLTGAFPDLPGAACTDTDPEAFHALEAHVIDQARNICCRCPAIRACLSWALDNDEYGVWAGTTRDQRHDLLDRHRRSHP